MRLNGGRCQRKVSTGGLYEPLARLSSPNNTKLVRFQPENGVGIGRVEYIRDAAVTGHGAINLSRRKVEGIVGDGGVDAVGINAGQPESSFMVSPAGWPPRRIGIEPHTPDPDRRGIKQLAAEDLDLHGIASTGRDRVEELAFGNADAVL